MEERKEEKFVEENMKEIDEGKSKKVSEVRKENKKGRQDKTSN